MSNEKRTITQQQHDNLLDALHNMWPSVPPENVFPELEHFGNGGADKARLNPEADCGTVACFGGWCAYWPAFRGQGLYIGSEGIPETRTNYGIGAAAELFGNRQLFGHRGSHAADPQSSNEVTDHELVTNRLRWELANTQVAA